MLRGGFWGYYVKKSGWLRLYGQRIWMLDVVLESIGLSVMISWLSWITLGLIVKSFIIYHSVRKYYPEKLDKDVWKNCFMLMTWH